MVNDLKNVFLIKILDESTFLNAEGRSTNESGRKANRRNLVRGVGNVATSFISSERNDSLGIYHFLHNEG